MFRSEENISSTGEIIVIFDRLGCFIFPRDSIIFFGAGPWGPIVRGPIVFPEKWTVWPFTFRHWNSTLWILLLFDVNDCCYRVGWVKKAKSDHHTVCTTDSYQRILKYRASAIANDRCSRNNFSSIERWCLFSMGTIWIIQRRTLHWRAWLLRLVCSQTAIRRTIMDKLSLANQPAYCVQLDRINQDVYQNTSNLTMTIGNFTVDGWGIGEGAKHLFFPREWIWLKNTSLE